MIRSWTKIRKKLEEEYLAYSLRGRIRYFCTSYSKCPDHEGRAAILLDGKQIISGSYREQWSNAHLLPDDETREKRLRTEFAFMDDTAVKLGMFDQRQFYSAFCEFDGQSIEESLASKNCLVRVFALLDRRVGRRRLMKLKETIGTEGEIFRIFFEIREKAEQDKHNGKVDEYALSVLRV